MPYYTHCQRCNSNGEYKQVDIDCGKCSGTGNNWSDDTELSYSYKNTNITLEQLKLDRVVKGNNNIKYFYADTLPKSIDEEREKVVRFRPKVTSFKDVSKKEIVIEEFQENLELFSKSFYLDNGLYIDKKEYKGSFDRVSLNISYIGVNYNTLDKLKEILSQFQDEDDKTTKQPLDLILTKYPEATELFEVQELWIHEQFHLLQFLTCKSANKFYKSSRRLHIIRATLLSEMIRCGIKVDINDKNIFDSILKFEDESIRSFFIELIEDSDTDLSIVNNFFDYKTSKTDLTVLDIFEGSAVAFQKLTNRTIEVKTIIDTSNSMHKRYFGAWDYFKEQGSNEQLLFFMISHQSLKYGLLDTKYGMNLLLPPQDIFIELCKNISKYEKMFDYNFFTAIPNHIRSQLEKFSLSDETISHLYTIFYIFNEITEDINNHCKEVDNFYYEKLFQKGITYDDNYIWSPIQKITEQLSKDFPLFETDYFLPLLLVDYTTNSTFFNYLPKMVNSISFQGIFDQDSDMISDNFMLQLVDDIDDFIRSGFTFSRCCKNHNTEKISRIELEFCEDEYSLKSRYKLLSGRDLDTLFNYN